MQAINKFDFPEGLTLTGVGMMCAKEHRLLREGLHDSHVEKFHALVACKRTQVLELRRLEEKKRKDKREEYYLQFI